MPGGVQAVSNGQGLERAVARIADEMGLSVARQVRVGRRLWGPVRKIDLVVRYGDSGRSLGIECKFQGGAGDRGREDPRDHSGHRRVADSRIGSLRRGRVLRQHAGLFALDWKGGGVSKTCEIG